MLPSDDATRAHTTTIDGYPVTAVDTNGAGDCHTGVLAAELLRGANLLEAVRVANVAAALAVTRRGPATCPTREEILHAMAATAQ